MLCAGLASDPVAANFAARTDGFMAVIVGNWVADTNKSG
jgi:hypothetical protein